MKKFMIVLLCSTALVLVVIFGKNSLPPACPDCNVVFVSLDTLSATHLPCYGYSRNTSPNLCAFAKKNIFFQNMFSNATWTLPGHVSMFTGLTASGHGVLQYPNVLDPKLPFLPNILQKNGYATIFLMPTDDFALPLQTVYNRGIDTVLDSEKTTWQQGLDSFAEQVRKGKKTMLFLHTYAVHMPYLTEDRPTIYTDETIPSIPKKKSELFAITEGFMDYLLSMLRQDIQLRPRDNADHTLQAITALLEQDNHDYSKLKAHILGYKKELRDYFFTYNYRQKIDTNNPKHIDFIRALYDQRIAELDTGDLSGLFSFLSEKEFQDNTVVIITADHGEEFMEHGDIEHETLFDPNLRVPLIVSVPGTASTTIKTNVQSADIVPTLLDILGIDPPSSFQGMSLMSLIIGKSLPDRILIADNTNDAFTAVRKGKWKLSLYPDGKTLLPYELYDTVKDPGETTNVLFTQTNIARTLLDEYRSSLRTMIR